MIDGLSNRAIAARLFISQPTAKLHVRHILEKLSARSRAEAVAKWRDVLNDA
jgi:DNA-binding NarL/FixJ family response regulator